MISYLNGEILNKGKGFVVLKVNNIGYKIFVNQNIWTEIRLGQKIEFYTYQHFTEQNTALYGLKDIDELEFFENLLSVSGVGPKTALGVFSVAKLNDIKSSIISGNFDLLNKVSGVGKKTAERIILELRNKISENIGTPKAGNSSIFGSDEIDALLSLGYNINQIRQVLAEIDPKIVDSREKIKFALKKLGR